MDEQSSLRVDDIREVFRYIGAYRRALFVFKIDYPGLVGHGFPSLVRDLVSMHEIGIRIVLVAGAREKIDEVLEQYQISAAMNGPVRVTSAQALPFVEMAAFNAATRLLTALTGHGISAVVGNWVRARTLGVRDGVDYGCTGEVVGVRVPELERIMNDRMIPVFPCIGWSNRGEPYNISSNQLAAVAASSLGADKLFYLTGGDPALPSRLTLAEARSFVGRRRRPEDREAAELLNLAVEACSTGVNRVHILNAVRDGTVLEEVFSAIGTGTMVYADAYERIRPMIGDDIPEVLRLMEPAAMRGAIVRRSEEELEGALGDFFVFDVDGVIHGCGGLRRYGDRAELYGLAVDPRYRELGVGRRIVEFLCDEAVRRGVQAVFLLTTQSYDWFHQLGFTRAGTDQLPGERRESYDERRNSRVMYRRL